MELLTIRESAELLRQHPASIRRKVRQGEIAAYRLGSGPRAPIRLAAEELERYVGVVLRSPPPYRAAEAANAPHTREGGDDR